MKRKLEAFVAIALTLTACGGGDVITEPTDGDTPVTSPDTTIAPAPASTSTPDTTAPNSEGTPPEDNPAPVGWPEGAFFVEGTELLIMESFPIQVRLDVSGTVPTPCNEPFWRVTDDGETVAVDLFTAADPDMACTQVITDMEVQIPLGSWAGESRSVELNGEVVGSFES